MGKKLEQKEKSQVRNHSNILLNLLLAILIMFSVLLVLFLVSAQYQIKLRGSGYNCMAEYNFTCSFNINYTKTGQISLNISQKIVYPTMYRVTFTCVGDNTEITNITKSSGILNTANSTMPYDIMVHVSDIQCYNRTGPVYVGPNTVFHGVLFIHFNINKERNLTTIASAIIISGKG